MNEHPETLRDHLEQLAPSERGLIEWMANWLAAWEWCESNGHCDGIGSHEYWRLTAQARAVGLAASQVAMRLWIKMETSLPPLPNPNHGGKS